MELRVYRGVKVLLLKRCWSKGSKIRNALILHPDDRYLIVPIRSLKTDRLLEKLWRG